MQYRCPENIAVLFDDDATIREGRKQAVEWASQLQLCVGDSVWLPEIGWTEKKVGTQ